jgi:CubicO group peptidase (beta-lactamase class C family)
MAWGEVAPESVGMDQRLVDAAVRCARERLVRHGASGQLVVLRRGQVVLDRAISAHPSSLFLLYSASKPYTAMLVHLLAQRGQIALDEPIVSHWPEFGRFGKQAITPRHVLQHRAGVPADNPVLALATMPDWRASVRRMERLVPRYPAGYTTAYHALTFGFILGELAHRVTGEPVDELLRRALLSPLGLRDTFLGLPDHAWPRAVRVTAAGRSGELGNALVFNRKRYRRAVIPAASISATARDVAVFYETLRRGGELHGTRVVQPETVAEAVRPATAGPEGDRVIGWRVRWAQGFQLGGVTTPTDVARCLGDLSGPTTYGHNGNACCTAWADPERELVFVYLTSLLLAMPEGFAHQGLVADCVLRACVA